MWTGWCDKGWCDNRLTHFSDVIKLLDCLTSLFEKGYEYKTVGCHRSTISAFHDYVDGKPVGQHPEVCALFCGIFNNRPPQSRYMFMWSVESIINYRKTKWKNNENLSKKYLTYKLVILMALTAATRASAMHCLDVRYMVKLEDAYILFFMSCIKVGERSKHHQNYIFISTQKIKNCVWCFP